MKTTIAILVLTLATSVLARPPAFDSEEYIDNNLSDSIPLEEDVDDERTDYLQM